MFRRRRRGNRGSRNPKQRSLNHVFDCFSRYTMSSGSTLTVTQKDMLMSFGAFAVSTTSLSSLAKSCKIHSVEVWCSGTAGASIELDWGNPTIASRNMLVSDTVMNSTDIAHVFSKPPANTQFADWFQTGTDVVFSLVTGASGTIEVHASFEMPSTDIQGLTSYTPSSSVSTADIIYYPCLDAPSGTHLAVPVLKPQAL